MKDFQFEINDLDGATGTVEWLEYLLDGALLEVNDYQGVPALWARFPKPHGQDGFYAPELICVIDCESIDFSGLWVFKSMNGCLVSPVIESTEHNFGLFPVLTTEAFEIASTWLEKLSAAFYERWNAN